MSSRFIAKEFSSSLLPHLRIAHTYSWVATIGLMVDPERICSLALTPLGKGLNPGYSWSCAACHYGSAHFYDSLPPDETLIAAAVQNHSVMSPACHKEKYAS